MTFLRMSTTDKIFYPNCGDPATNVAGKSTFNPDVSPFTPSTELGTWQVVAAEYTGKAVAVMAVGGESQLLVCTSSSFNSKCRHPGRPCLDWDNVKLAPGQGSQPDSGLDNTDQSEEERDRILRVAQWSADAARQTEAAKGGEWSEIGLSPVWGGETQFVHWSPLSDQSAERQQYNNFHITVEYHTTKHDNSVYDPVEEPLLTRRGFGNDPLYVCHDQPPVSEDSWACGLGIDFSKMEISETKPSLDITDIKQVDLAEQERIREEFKNKILGNIGVNNQETEERRKRQEFKRKVLSNIEKNTISEKCDEIVRDNDEDRIRNDFKNQILSNIRRY